MSKNAINARRPTAEGYGAVLLLDFIFSFATFAPVSALAAQEWFEPPTLPARYVAAMNLVKDGKCKEGLAALWRLAARGDYDAVWMVIETTSSGGFYFMPHAPIPDVHPLRGMTNTFPRSMLPVFLYATLSRGIFNGRSVIPKDETIRWAVTQLKAHGADSTGGQLIGCFSNLIDEMRTTNTDAQTKVSKARICVDLAETVGVIPPFEEFAAERIENPASANRLTVLCPSQEGS